MNTNKTTVGIVIPTYNGGLLWKKVVQALQAQRADFDKVLVIDSGSTDNTVMIAQQAEFVVEKIPSSEFDYGSTRNLCVNKIDCDIVVFLTQDAIPADNAISLITKVFDNDRIAVAYGRQLPHDDATPISEHARLFNYGKEGYIYELCDKDKHGIRTVFASNSFSAYNKKLFIGMGGFCCDSGSEDMHFAAKALLSGYKVCYAAEATCQHSHNYSSVQIFNRYFDVGVFHKNHAWISNTFGKPKKEGIKFVLSELSFLWKKRNLPWIPIAFINNFFKLLGYSMGLKYKMLPRKLVVYFSAYKSQWSNVS